MTSAQALLTRCLRRTFKTPPDLLPSAWAEQYRRMGSDESAFTGRFTFRHNPFLKWLIDRYADPAVRKIVCQKSAQIGWTQAVICNLLGYFVHVKRTTAITMFPKELAARNFDLEKFRPMVDSTPVLAEVLPAKKRTADVKTLFKKYPGGFIKFVGSNSIADVKSTSARDLVVEEPDDCNLNLKGQGDAIALLAERGKSFRDGKMLIGGTPSIEDISSIAQEMEMSDKNYWEVPCPECGTYQRLTWKQVVWQKEEKAWHPVLGRHKPDTARYMCADPACGCLWSNAQKNAAVQRGRAVATAPFRGVVGLYINELYSSFAESSLERLAEKYLTAHYEQEKGNAGEMIAFWNASLGLPYRYKGSTPEISDLKEKALQYELGTVPAGLLLTMGVDVQHNRLALVVRAWGMGEESWLVWWEEIPGNVVDETDDCWRQLEAMIFRSWPHVRGWQLKTSAVSIDSSDGQTNDAVYAFVRRMKGRGVAVMAIKGSSDANAEIFSKARISVDANVRGTKASRYGLRPFSVGTDKAKDLLLGESGRVKMPGEGPGRFHYPTELPDEYFKQLTSEVKVPRWDNARGRRIVPSRTARNLLVWAKKSSARNEVLDCEVYALHAARSQRVHLKKPADWQALEQIVSQAALFAAPPVELLEDDDDTVAPDAPTSQAPQPRVAHTPPARLPGRLLQTRREVATADDPHLN